MVPSVTTRQLARPDRLYGRSFFWQMKVGIAGIGSIWCNSCLCHHHCPVELDASNRAKGMLTSSGILYSNEMKGVESVLNAAALTYVAGAIQVVSTLLYYALMLFGGRRRN